MALSEEIRRSEFSTEDRELGRPELTPPGERSGAVELEIVARASKRAKALARQKIS